MLAIGLASSWLPARYFYRFDAEALSCRQPTCRSVCGDIPYVAPNRVGNRSGDARRLIAKA